MKPPLPNITAEQWAKLVEDRRQFQFVAGARWSLTWKIKARQHKRSADIIYEVARTADERQLFRFVEEVRSGITTGSRTVMGQEQEDMLDRDLIWEYYLLIGYTLECLFKGYLLTILPELVQNENCFDRLIITHDLVRLCRDANMAVSEEETQILGFLTQCIIWQSKYPVPLRLADTPSPLEPPNEPQKVRNPYRSGLKNVLDDLCDRASTWLEAERKKLNP